MDTEKVVRLDISEAYACELREKTWNEALQELNTTQVQIIFASTQSFLNTPPKLREDLENRLKIPRSFFDRLHLQSNGFSAYDVWLDPNEKVDSYTYWSRFTVKQTYEKLKQKRTFTPYVSNHCFNPHNWTVDATIHGPQSARHGWEWYEMGFFTYWHRSGLVTLLCFDLPTKSRLMIQSMFVSQSVNSLCPYATFSVILDALLQLYDDSVWSIRNHICQWEARRLQETDYFHLHEIARHGIHVSETLNVATRSLHAIQHHQEVFRANTELVSDPNKPRSWNKVSSRLDFQLQFLQGLLQRSEANNARIQNEIMLAFNAAAQRDSKIQVRIGEEAKIEASAMKAIAVVTMTFLPATFVSTIFGMNFFSFGPDGVTESSSFIVSNHFWIYWALSVPMTVATLALWLWWSRCANPIGLSSSRANAPRTA